jgi:hypothetical protein
VRSSARALRGRAGSRSRDAPGEALGRRMDQREVDHYGRDEQGDSPPAAVPAPGRGARAVPRIRLRDPPSTDPGGDPPEIGAGQSGGSHARTARSGDAGQAADPRSAARARSPPRGDRAAPGGCVHRTASSPAEARTGTARAGSTRSFSG